MNSRNTDPAVIDDIGSTESLPVEITFTAWLGAATIASSVATLVDLETGVAYAAGLGTKSATTTTVTQTLTALQPGRRYRLTVTVTDSTGRVWASRTIVECDD